jgi:hypothetical protein
LIGGILKLQEKIRHESLVAPNALLQLIGKAEAADANQ